MGTAKRERQKANRALKLEQQAKQERVQKVKRTGTRWLLTALGLILVVLAVLWAAGVFKGDESDSTADATGTAATGTAASTVPVTAPVTYPPMSTPTVSIPATLPTEVKVTELVPGEGPKAAAGDTVTVYYVGVNSADGVEFDNSYETGTAFPVQVGTGQVIQGWDEGLIGVQKGGRYQIDIPSEKAYGSEGHADIKPDQALTFVIDVLAVEPVTK